MADFCMICECEPVENKGWFTNADKRPEEFICPWCIRDMKKIKEMFVLGDRH